VRQAGNCPSIPKKVEASELMCTVWGNIVFSPYDHFLTKKPNREVKVNPLDWECFNDRPIALILNIVVQSQRVLAATTGSYVWIAKAAKQVSTLTIRWIVCVIYRSLQQ
jgi:hypothetical protein